MPPAVAAAAAAAVPTPISDADRAVIVADITALSSTFAEHALNKNTSKASALATAKKLVKRDGPVADWVTVLLGLLQKQGAPAHTSAAYAFNAVLRYHGIELAKTQGLATLAEPFAAQVRIEKERIEWARSTALAKNASSASASAGTGSNLQQSTPRVVNSNNCFQVVNSIAAGRDQSTTAYVSGLSLGFDYLLRQRLRQTPVVGANSALRRVSFSFTQPTTAGTVGFREFVGWFGEDHMTASMRKTCLVRSECQALVKFMREEYARMCRKDSDMRLLVDIDGAFAAQAARSEDEVTVVATVECVGSDAIAAAERFAALYTMVAEIIEDGTCTATDIDKQIISFRDGSLSEAVRIATSASGAKQEMMRLGPKLRGHLRKKLHKAAGAASSSDSDSSDDDSAATKKKKKSSNSSTKKQQENGTRNSRASSSGSARTGPAKPPNSAATKATSTAAATREQASKWPEAPLAELETMFRALNPDLKALRLQNGLSGRMKQMLVKALPAGVKKYINPNFVAQLADRVKAGTF